MLPGKVANAEAPPPLEVSAVTSKVATPEESSPPLIVVEVHPWVGRSIEPQLLRRLVQLELSDVEVPEAPPGDCLSGRLDSEDEFPRSLYVRVLPSSSETLTVELWSRGERSGERGVSGEGPAQLAARRVAFAAAMLGRRLRQERLDQRDQYLRACELEAEAARHRPGMIPMRGRLTWQPRAVAATLGGLNAWLVGSEAQAALDFESGPALALGIDMRAGDSARLPERSDLRWYGLSLRPGANLNLSDSVRLRLGVALRAGILRFAGVQPQSTPRDATTWTSSAALDTELSLGSPDDLTWQLGIEAGSTLRRVDLPRVASDAGAERPRTLGGLWLGVQVGVGLPL